MVRKMLLLFFVIFLLLTGCNSVGKKGEEQAQKKPVVATTTESEVEKEPQVQEVIQEQVDKTPTYRLNPRNWEVEPISTEPANVVLLTIDDAPDKYALEMAKTLKELDAKAIFFVNGHFIDTEEEKKVLKEIFDMGFPIGNHTWNHKNLSKQSESEQRQAIVSVNDEVERITGERPKFFRAPYGVNTDFSRKVVSDEKMLLMNWSFGYDYNKEYMNKDALTNITLNTNLLHNGVNILMHDREWTNAALKDIVIGLRDKGFIILDPQKIETVK